MVGHIAQPVYYHHACNIGGIGNCYGLNNCLICGHNLCNYYHHRHIHLCLDNYRNNCYCNSLNKRCLIVHSYFGIGPYNCFVVAFPFVGIFCHLVDLYLVCGLCYYLCNSHYDNSCLSLHTVPLIRGEGEVVDAVVEVLISLYLISFLLYLLSF